MTNVWSGPAGSLDPIWHVSNCKVFDEDDCQKVGLCKSHEKTKKSMEKKKVGYGRVNRRGYNVDDRIEGSQRHQAEHVHFCLMFA